MKTEYLLKKELERVLAVLTPVNRLIVRTMIETGLRISDVLSLEFWQISNNFWVTERKTGKRKHVGLSTQLVDDIRASAAEYIPREVIRDAAGKKKGAATAWAFPSPRDWRNHRTRQGVWKDIKRAARAFRIDANVAPHSMRKYYAVELMKKYGDIERVRRALNHSDTSITLIYAMADSLVSAGRLAKISGASKRR